jgi:hypothetical protein
VVTSATNEHEQLWIAHYERNRAAYPDVLRNDPFVFWERDQIPEMAVDEELRAGLHIAYAWGTAHEQALAFLRRACSVAQRIIGEDKLTSPECVGGFPLNRGRVYRSYSYARALLGEPLDVEAVEQSSRDFEEWCRGYGKGEWDSQAQANYLASVRLALISGNLDRARELLKTKKSFRWHKDEHELWKILVEKREEIRRDEEFAHRFSRLFDKLRVPGFVPDVYIETDILRLELPAIREKYLVDEDGVIKWSRAVDLVPGRLRPPSFS